MVSSATGRWIRAQTADNAFEEVKRTWGDPAWAIKLLIRARDAAWQRAERLGKEFPLRTEDIIHLMARSMGRCEVSGLPFSEEEVPGCNKRPFIPTIDRIHAKEPYSFDNCRLACWVVNRAMNDWGDDVFWRMVRSASLKL